MSQAAHAPKVVFIADVFPSHAHSMMGLARRLEKFGFRVEYWGPPRVAATITAQGFLFRPLQGLWPFYEHLFPDGVIGAVLRPDKLLDTFRALKRRRRTLPGALDVFERSLELLLHAHTPDLAVFHPFTLAYYPYFMNRGIKCVALQDKPAPIRDPLVPPPDCGLIPGDSPLGRLRIASHWLRYGWAAHVRRHRERLLARLGCYTPELLIGEIQRRTGARHGARVDRGLSYDLHFSDVPEWLLDSPELSFPQRTALPANLHYIGMCVDSERRHDPTPVTRKPNTRHLIYVSMGVSMRDWRMDLRLLRRLIDGLRVLPDSQLVVSTGNERACAVLRNEFPDIDIHGFVPQLQVLALADLAITHAGPNTVRECVLTGIPMLAFPRQYDQPTYAARVVFHGLGLRVSRRFATRASIRRKALRILTDTRFRERVRQAGDALTAIQQRQIDTALRPLFGDIGVGDSGHSARSHPRRIDRHEAS